MNEHESNGQEAEAEQFTEQLGHFTPHHGTLDRDAILFAAGRASANRHRGWKLLAGTLAASQLLTLALFWPQPANTMPSPVATATIASGPAANTEAEPAVPSEIDSFQLSRLRQELFAGGRAFPTPRVDGASLPDPPPLRAMSRAPDEFMN